MKEEKREISYDNENKLVVSNKYIRAIHPDRMNINAMKLFRLVVTQCRLTDEKFYSYEIKIKDFANAVGIDSSNIYKDTETMCLNLMQMILKVSDSNSNNWVLKHIFEKCSYEEGSGIITIQLHADMTNLFLQLRKNFTKIPIAAILTMKSKYSLRIYELICEKMMSHYPYADVSTCIQITLEEVKEITNTTKKKTYNQISNFKNKVLLPALKEVEEHAEWKIIQTDIKRGRKITGFNLEIWSKNGYEVVQECIRTGTPLPKRKENLIPGQISLFDLSQYNNK